MKIGRRISRRIGIVVAILIIGVGIAGFWVVPRLIVREIRASYEGAVSIDGWWLGGSSSGITGLKLHETEASDSPVWLHVGRVSTDLGLRELLRGRRAPKKVEITAPSVAMRLDKDGQPLTLPKFRAGKGGGEPAPLPEILAKDASVSFAREGRPTPMVVSGIGARVKAGPKALALSAGTEDAEWGAWTVFGSSAPTFATGAITIRGNGVKDATAKLERVPFVPPEVAQNVKTNGPVDVDVVLRWGGKVPIDVGCRIALASATLEVPILALTTTNTKGIVVVQGSEARIQGVTGDALGGRVAVNGRLDFGQQPPRFEVGLELKNIDVASAPKAWQLDEAGVIGRLSGEADLKIALAKDGPDLTGSTGEAEIEHGRLEGIDVKSLKLAMTAQGSDIRYSSGKTAGEAKKSLQNDTGANQGKSDPKSGPVDVTPEVAAQHVVDAIRSRGENPAEKKGLVLPKSISTRIELEDVDLKTILAKGEALGIHLPFPVAGILSLNADATIPLGDLKNIKGYVFRGNLDLKGASIDGVDLGRLSTRVDLADGVLDLADFRGRLLDRPAGDNKNPPPQTEPPPIEGPLPVGGFRGHLRAELSPPGPLTGRFEADRLPVGEIAAPFFPEPTPVSGLLSLSAKVDASITSLSDPKAWSVSADVESERIAYRGSMLDSFSAKVAVKDGRLDVTEFRAHLDGEPLTARLGAGLSAPYPFETTLDIDAWKIGDLLALIPSISRPAPVDGVLSVRAEAKGTLSPLVFESNGRGNIAKFRAGAVVVGDVPIAWETKAADVLVSIPEARPFGGVLNARVAVPLKGGSPIQGSATAKGVDAAILAGSIPGIDVKMAGKADARVDFRVPPGAGVLEASLSLNAPELTVQGIPADGVEATVEVRKGIIKYELFAKSLGGRVKFQGDFPIGPAPPKPEADARLQIAGIALDGIWPALKLDGMLGKLGGRVALDANLRTLPNPIAPRSHGIIEARDLHWGPDLQVGGLRGTIVSTPLGWRLEPVSGDVFGGSLAGAIWGESPFPGLPLGFDVRLERASMAGLAGFAPSIAKKVSGDLTVRLSGQMRDSLRGDGEMAIDRANVFGVDISQLHGPMELTFAPAAGSGTLLVRDLTARVAGGQVRGSSKLRFGADRSFSAELSGSGLGLESALKPLGDVGRSTSGKVSGKVVVSGPDPADFRRIRGRIDVDLDDASIADVPIFREIDKFLGSARGGLFEDGDLHASIADRRLIIEEFTLAGRLAQVHGSGTIGADGRLDMEVLINTNQLITQSGDALAGSIPGLRSGRGDAARLFSGYLADRLLKLRVGGTISAPQVTSDPGVVVTNTAAAFFGTVLKLPLGLVR